MHLTLTLTTFEDPPTRRRLAQTNARYVLHGASVHKAGEIADDPRGMIAEMEGLALARQLGATRVTVRSPTGSVKEVSP